MTEELKKMLDEVETYIFNLPTDILCGECGSYGEVLENEVWFKCRDCCE